MDTLEEFEEKQRRGREKAVFERLRDDCLEKLAAERAEIRGMSLDEGRREGLKEGRVVGRREAMASQRETVRRLAAKRFKAETAERLAEFVSAIDDPEHLAEVGVLTVECDTDDELLGRLHELHSRLRTEKEKTWPRSSNTP